MWLKKIVPAAVLLCASGSSVTAQTPSPVNTTEEEITIDAESLGYDQKKDVMNASGNVVIQRGAMELRAEDVQLNRRTNEAEATGDVTLIDPQAAIFADRMEINLDTETGELVDARVQGRQQQYSLSGDLIRKGEGQTYHIANGLFTTCNCAKGPPSWSIGADILDVALRGYAVLDGVRFNVLDQPVFCLPRLILPVIRERQSGLLLPRVGISNRRGFQLLQPFYWAISKSEDATLAADIESSARLGLVGEYRYAVSRDFQGTIGASYFNESIRGTAQGAETSVSSEPTVPENRWSVTTRHTQRLGSVEGYADLLLVSDNLFLREINTFALDYERELSLRTRPFTDSRVGLLQRWNRLTLQADGVYYQDLVQSDDLVLQHAPEMRLFGQKQIGLGALGRLDSNVTDFVREKGIDGLRADLQPGVEMRLPLGRSVTGSTYVTLHETMYQLAENRMSGGFLGDTNDPNAEAVVLPRTHARETVELGAKLGTEVSRVMSFDHFGFDKLKHTIEPRLEYLFIPNVAQDDDMVFDGLDRIEQRSLFTYGFDSRLLARRAGGDEKSKGRVMELTRFSVSQSYDVDRKIPSSTSALSADHFSDVDVAIRVNPDRNTTIRATSSFDPVSASFSTASLGVRLLEPFGRTRSGHVPKWLIRSSLGIAYRFVTNDPLQNAIASVDRKALTDIQPEGIQEVDSSLLLPLTERLGFRFASRYNIRDASFLEKHFGLRVLSSCDCWNLELGFSDKSNPNEIEFRAQLNLVGLGSAGPESTWGVQ
jgi:LPS-assembly protein